jgi:DNA-directed RNA polymerase subunit RPC12/RpoP
MTVIDPDACARELNGPPTIQMDFVCSRCGYSFRLELAVSLLDEERRCPQCDSKFIRQTFASCLRNGPFLDPKWGLERERPGCG